MNTFNCWSRMRRCVLVWMVGGFLLHLPLTGTLYAAEPRPEIGRAEAHQFMINGDQARDRRQWADAIRYYQAAMEMYRALGLNAPAWDQDYYSFREEYNRREIRLIERETGRTAEAWLETETTLTGADAERYRILYLTMRQENQQLRDRLKELEEDLELMLEMEELDRQRERAIRQRREAIPAEPERELDRQEPEIDAIPTEPIPSAAPERGVFRRRSPSDPVPR